MFTGIIEALGKVTGITPHATDISLKLESEKLDFSAVKPGDSIAVNGVCLTVIQCDHHSFTADVSAETLTCTTIKDWMVGMPVNLEQALTLSKPLGGHWVSGHVDAVGTVKSIRPSGLSQIVEIEFPSQLGRYIAVKGSICVDGISLTVNAITHNSFYLNIVPHTWQQTAMAYYKVGKLVNLEVDIIARYLERLLIP